MLYQSCKFINDCICCPYLYVINRLMPCSNVQNLQDNLVFLYNFRLFVKN